MNQITTIRYIYMHRLYRECRTYIKLLIYFLYIDDIYPYILHPNAHTHMRTHLYTHIHLRAHTPTPTHTPNIYTVRSLSCYSCQSSQPGCGKEVNIRLQRKRSCPDYGHENFCVKMTQRIGS